MRDTPRGNVRDRANPRPAGVKPSAMDRPLGAGLHVGLIMDGSSSQCSSGLSMPAAELFFMDTLWPDFDGEDLRRAVEAFRRRERRYGGLPTETAIRAAS